MWNSITTQWRTDFGALVGLDYPALFAVAKCLNIDVTPAMMEKIRLYEQKEIEKWQKESDKHGSQGRTDNRQR